jgi:hypothetical protein
VAVAQCQGIADSHAQGTGNVVGIVTGEQNGIPGRDFRQEKTRHEKNSFAVIFQYLG